MAAAPKKIQRTNRQAPDSPRILFSVEIEVEKHFSKKNAKTIHLRRGGSSRFAKRTGFTPFISAKPDARSAEQYLVYRLLEAKQRVGLREPIDCPVHVVWTFQLENHFTKKGTVNLRAGDLSNLVQGVEDALQKAEILRDDGLIVSSWMQKVNGPNKILVMIQTAW